MAAAIKKISIERGHDVGGYALVCFGGAGGQHACAVADAIGIKRIMIHPLAGVLSAYGIGLAEQRLLRHKCIEQELSAALLPALAEAFDALEREMLFELRDDRRRVDHARYGACFSNMPGLTRPCPSRLARSMSSCAIS